ncbi:MAG TPA: hypothetical protein VFW76_07210 [Ktedonobacterales bacterium]|nr:hypothetical protein [Ktedonobacterales bacterium]
MRNRQRAPQRYTHVPAPVSVSFAPTLRIERGDEFYACSDPLSGRRIILTAQAGAAIDTGCLTGLGNEAMQEVESLIMLGMVRVVRAATLSGAATQP